MSDRFNINESINNIFARLEDFIKTKTVVGEPIEVGEVTIIPFIDISFGVGIGGGSGQEQPGNQGTGGGAGSGGKISPSAVLVIIGNETELLPISKAGSLERILEIAPDIVSKFKDIKSKDDNEGKSEEE